MFCSHSLTSVLSAVKFSRSSPGFSASFLESWFFAFFLLGESLSPSVETSMIQVSLLREIYILFYNMAICHFEKSQ